MDFESWQTRADPRRRRRLLAGGAVGVVAMAVSAHTLISSAGSLMIEAEEEATIVSLEEELPKPDEAEPEPEPEPEPVGDEAVQAAGPRLASLRPPTEIPKETPKEVDPASGDGAGGAADPYAATGGRGRTGAVAAAPAMTAAPKATVKAPPPPPPTPKAVTLTEGMTPPVPIATPQPAYPDDLKAQGIEGVVVVRMKVDENGAIVAAKLVSGPPAFWPSIAATLKTWRFTPARDAQGRSVSVTIPRSFRFRLDTGE